FLFELIFKMLIFQNALIIKILAKILIYIIEVLDDVCNDDEIEEVWKAGCNDLLLMNIEKFDML
ncbi:hypothetical protein L9F63_008158, partial [Diploptera punctata]